MPNKFAEKNHAVVIGLILAGILFSGFFGFRAFHAYKNFNGMPPPPHGKPGKIETDVEMIRGWMTIPFIAELYNVPETALYESLDIVAIDNKEKSLKEINHYYFPDQDGYVIKTVKEAVRTLQKPEKVTP